MAAPEHLRTLPPPNATNMANATLRFYKDIPLAPESLQARVLRLSPGLRNDPISASVERMDLEYLAYPYTTLSYTWGDQADTKPIMIGDEVYQATTNLYDALQHVRSKDHPIVIWVDAICINQWDLAEKSSQVGFMAEIYRRCEKVYIWLGRPSQPTEIMANPFGLFEHFRDDKHYQDLPGYQWDETTKSWTCQTEDPAFRAMWDSFLLVFASPWWTRAWTVQETILPPDALVMFGDFSIHWSDIALSRVKRNAHIYTYTEDCCGFSHEAIPSELIQPFDKTLGDVEDLDTIRTRNGYYKTFQEIERGFASRMCKDPRDKIWSLLSFSPSDHTRYPVDYTTPVAEVFSNAFRNMLIETGGNLQCLLGYGFNSGTLGLPSWARNFSDCPPSHVQNFLQNRRLFVIYPLFNACGGREGTARLLDAPNELHLRGVCVDRVTAVGKACNDFWSDDLKSLMTDWWELCQSHGILIRRETLDERFSHLLCGEVVDDPGENASGLWRLVTPNDPDLPSDHEWASLMSEGNGWALPRKYRGAVNTTIAGRALYTTKAGRLGLSLHSVKPDDEVWAIDGSRVPLVLRPTSDSTTKHLLIGETHLQGVMHGEAIFEGVDSTDVIVV